MLHRLFLWRILLNKEVKMGRSTFMIKWTDMQNQNIKHIYLRPETPEVPRVICVVKSCAHIMMHEEVNEMLVCAAIQ